MEPLTEDELGQIASEHVHSDWTGPMGLLEAGSCAQCDCAWPCDAARLYQLVIRQAALLADWGLPCALHPDFDLPDVPDSNDPGPASSAT